MKAPYLMTVPVDLFQGIAETGPNIDIYFRLIYLYVSQLTIEPFHLLTHKDRKN